ncbi:MAG TPA: hypothetical protein VN790_10230 [Steroidobacteraceae bacterium]|nr:hypothetical protein [Steroidobacteraceae bacterium]
MRFGKRTQLGLLALAMALGSIAALAGDARTLSDDKCVAQCDEQSDKCMIDAAKDASKQRQCDSTYDECLRKCG